MLSSLQVHLRTWQIEIHFLFIRNQFVRNRVLVPIKIEKRLELQKFSPFEIRKFIYEKNNLTVVFIISVLILLKTGWLERATLFLPTKFCNVELNFSGILNFAHSYVGKFCTLRLCFAWSIPETLELSKINK